MAITIRIPYNYSQRIYEKIKNSGDESNPGRFAANKLAEQLKNIAQPDGSILVQTSADNEYDAVREVFAQNLGIPFAAILGFDSRVTFKSEKGISPKDIFDLDGSATGINPNLVSGLETQPQDIAAPITGAGDNRDLSFSERIVPGQISEGPATPFDPAQVLTPSFYSEDEAEEQRLLDLDMLETEMLGLQARAGLGDSDVPPVVPPAGPDPVTMPANLPPFWKEKYNEYLGLPGGQQQAILDNQLQNYIDLNDWQISTGGGTGEEGGGVSGAAGADLTLQELEALAAGGTTGGGGAGGGFGFQTGAFTGAGNIPQPMNFEGFPVTGLQDMLNIFYSKPDRFIVEQPVMGTIGYDEKTGLPIEGIVGSQQSLSPVAEAALRAFSTQRGTESADLASRFGTSTPFGAIAGLGGTSADAVGLAELQARAGVTNPYAALGTGETIGDIGTILRGGLTVEQQTALAGMQARGGLSADERLAEQRLGILPSLFQTTPQALGGLSRVLGGEEALQRALAPFFGGVAAQGAAPQQGVTANISGSPFGGQPVNMNIAGPAATQQPTPSFRPTLGDYQGAGMFEQGGFQAEAGIAGQELPKFLGEVSPQGTSTARGGLGATTTGRFTY